MPKKGPRRGPISDVGARVRLLRERLGWNPTQLAAQIDVSASAITSLEEGFTSMPTFENGLKMARGLGVTPWFLMYGSEMPGTVTRLPSSTSDALPARRAPAADPGVEVALQEGLVAQHSLLDAFGWLGRLESVQRRHEESLQQHHVRIERLEGDRSKRKSG